MRWSAARSTSGSSVSRGADSRLQMRPVLDERLVAALGPHTRWSRRAGLRSVASEPFTIISRDRSASFYDHVLARARRCRICAAGSCRKPRNCSPWSRSCAPALGVALVPRSTALMRLPGVRFHELDIPEAAWNIALAWHSDSDRVPLVRRFIAAVPPRPANTIVRLAPRGNFALVSTRRPPRAPSR